MAFYHKHTGTLHQTSVVVSDDAAVALNTPPDHVAVDQPASGPLDPLSQKVDVATGKVIDWQPPQPSDDHEWRGRRWRLTATAEEQQRRRTLAIIRRGELLEQQHDLMRRLVLNPQDEDARTALAALHAEMESLQADLQRQA